MVLLHIEGEEPNPRASVASWPLELESQAVVHLTASSESCFLPNIVILPHVAQAPQKQRRTVRAWLLIHPDSVAFC